MVEGIGEDFLPSISDFSRVHKAYADQRQGELPCRSGTARQRKASSAARRVAPSSAAALKYCREQTTKKRVVAFVCDTGNKYLSKMYNDYWMLDNGFLERPVHNGDCVT
jgi:cystathionine beta-synthase